MPAALLDYATGQPCGLTVEGPDDLPAATARLFLAPALLDLQINGYAGVDFQQDNLPEAALRRAAAALARDGCGRFFAALITAPWPALLARVRRLAAQVGKIPGLAGLHVEGPWLSDRPGFCGAHDPAWMHDPSPAQLAELLQAAAGVPLLLTLAPERPGAAEVIRAATRAGAAVSLGHTDADAAQLRAAVDAGAAGFTHLGNGCPPQLDRHDNILWRTLDFPALRCGLIPDGRHLPPPVFRGLHRALGPERAWFTTDAMAAAGAPPGEYTLGALRLAVGADGVVRLPGRPNFAGSALRPEDGVRRAAAMLGVRWPAVWDGCSRGPARLTGLPDAWPPPPGQPVSVVAEDERGGLLAIRPARLPPRAGRHGLVACQRRDGPLP